jgi:membrane fusion protein (multidrug efflux system)
MKIASKYRFNQNMKNRFLILLLLTSITMTGCNSRQVKPGASGAPAIMSMVVEGIIVKPTLLNQIIYVSGTLKPYEETTLMPEVPGRIVSINLPEGQGVKAHTLLVKLFDGDLQAQLRKSETQLKITEQTLSRQAELLKISGISQSDYDQTDLQVISIKNDIELIKVSIKKTEVLAPYDGEIGLRNISIGAQVTTSTALAVIREVDKLKLDFSVPEKYSNIINKGGKLKFLVQGDETKYDAIVMATEQSIEANTRNLKARAVVNKNSASLIPGAFANVELSLGENPKALMVPTQAIIPTERDKKLIVVKGGKATFVAVKTGVRESANIEVTEGISPGDTIVTTGILFLKPGATVNFSKITK